jgi:subtilisin family serine protease
LVSSINSYDTTFVKGNGKICANVVSGGRTYTWGQMSGTSMACPAAVGIIALWLQANPNLTAEGIKEVFKNTSIHDSFTAAAPQKSGFGKIDALAGLKYILNTTGVKGAICKSTVVSLYPNPSNGEFSIYVPGESGNLSLSIYNIGGGLVYSKSFDASSGTVNVNIGGSVAPGIYIAHITGARTNFSSRLILK